MKKIIVFIIVICPLLSFAQKEGQSLIDSLLVELPKMEKDSLKVINLNELSITYKGFNSSQGLQYGNKALDLANKLHWNNGIAESYNSIAANYFSSSDYPKAKEYYFKALKATKNKKLISKVLKNIGGYYTYQGNYSKGLDFSFQALKISEELKDEKNIAKVLSNIGVNYFNLKKYNEAILYYEKALKINTKIGVKMSMSLNLRNMGHAYRLIKQDYKAIESYNRAIKIDNQLKNKEGTATDLASISVIYYKLKQYNKALEYSSKSLIIAQEINRPDIIAINYNNFGGIYLQMAKNTRDKVNIGLLLNKASINSNAALEIYKKAKDLIDLYSAYDQLSSIDELKGNYKTALEYYKTSIVYKDSIFNSDNKETIKNLEDKRTIELRDKELKINKLTIESEEKQKWYFVFGVALLAIIGGLLFYQSRNRKKNNNKLQILNSELDKANKVKAQFFGILNHDLRSPVANLIHFLHLQKENPELLDTESRTRMENKTMSSAENLLTSMEDILLWSKGQMKNFKPQPKNTAINLLFEDTQRHFSSEEKIQFSFENFQNIEINTDENYLKTIIRNLTGNAIKAMENTENPIIVWKAWQENNKTFLSISDNGTGGTQEQFKALYDDTEVMGIKTGLGLHLIRDLARAIDCEISIDTKPNEGTTFTLFLK